MESAKNTFDHQVPSEKGIKTIEVLRESYKTLQSSLDLLKDSRELSIAKTKLEESAMWAIKSVVFNEQ